MGFVWRLLCELKLSNLAKLLRQVWATFGKFWRLSASFGDFWQVLASLAKLENFYVRTSLASFDELGKFGDAFELIFG